MGLTFYSARTYVQRLYAKLGVSSLRELWAWADKNREVWA
jgi:hypothetical protein